MGDVSGEDEKAQRCGQFWKVVGALINLSNPLSIKDLSELLFMNESVVDAILQRLHSVVSVDQEDERSPLQLLHLSFRDFLLNEERCSLGDFRIHQKDAHQSLLLNFLDVMSTTLKQDICSFADPSICASDVKNSRLEQSLPHHVQYACVYWVEHLRGAESQPLDGGEVFQFLTQHLLHWLEALSLMGQLSQGVVQVLALTRYTDGLPVSFRAIIRF